MNIENTPPNGFNIIQNIFHKKPIGSDANHLFEDSNAIFKLIHSDQINNKELANRLDSIKECFLKCTKENASELSLEEKISLNYAFRDILDEVNLKMHQNASIRNSQSQGPTGFAPVDGHITLALYIGNLAFKGLMYTADRMFPDAPDKFEFRTTEEEVIKKIQNAFISIDRDKRFEKYETQLMEKKRNFEVTSPKEEIKSFFTSFFDHKKSPEALEKDNSIKLINRCIEVKNVMKNEHDKKTENLSITRPMYDWQGTFDPLLDKVYDTLLTVEEALIVKALKPYTPQEFFNGKSFAELLTSTVDSKVSKSNDLLRGLSAAIGEPALQDIRKRLANNLKLITEDYNLARFTIHMNTNIAKVFTILDKLDPNSTQDDLIKMLGIVNPNGKPLTTEEFMKTAHGNILSRLCKLCCLEQKESSEGIEGFVKSGWTKLGNASLEITLTSAMKQLFNLNDLKKFLSDIPRLKKEENATPFWGGTDKINTHMDIIALFLIDSLVTEMATIASQARRLERINLPTDVSHIADEKASDEVKKSTLSLVRAIRNFTLPTELETKEILKEQGLLSSAYGALTNYLTFAFINYVVDTQGEGHLKDIATPTYNEFIKKWTSWVSE